METKTLTKEMALEFAEKIVQLHNLIPFQKWSIEDLLLESDEKRTYKSKWEISSVCFIENILVGVCIAFEDNQSNINGVCDFVYLHRIVVQPEYRFRGIGSNLIMHTCKCFHGINSIQNNTSVFVLTPIKALNNMAFENAEEFYLKLGFNKVGEKEYTNKIDSILSAPLKKIIQ